MVLLIQKDSLLRDVTRALALKLVQSPRRVPLWDLFLDLQVLMKPPFEPISSVSLKFVTWKTVFFMSLALGRRGSDVYSLSGSCRDIAREPDGSFSLRFFARVFGEKSGSRLFIFARFC